MKIYGHSGGINGGNEMRRYQITMLHPNPNANQVWTVRAKNKFAARSAAHERMVRTGQFFTTGDVVAA